MTTKNLASIAPQNLASAPNLLTIQDGDYTININFISEIDWTPGEECTVSMITGNEFTLECDDYYALRVKLGLDEDFSELTALSMGA